MCGLSNQEPSQGAEVRVDTQKLILSQADHCTENLLKHEVLVCMSDLLYSSALQELCVMPNLKRC